MKVDYASLNSASEVLARQAEDHVPRMREYIAEYGQLEPGDLGLILGFLQPINQALVTMGCDVIDGTATVYRLAAESMDETLTRYIDADRAVYEGIEAWAQRLGVAVPNFTDPRGSLPALGAASGGAGAGYGAGEPNVFAQAWRDGSALGKYARDTPTQVAERLGEFGASSRTVTEQSDASSFLVPPVSTTSEVENMRWSAGPIFGGVDWVFEKLFGFSFLEDVIMKPFAGNWTRIDEASIAWGHVDDSLMAVASNASGLCPPLASWEGRGSEAALAAMATIAAGTMALSYAAGFVSQLVGTVATVAKAVAAGIGLIIKQISNKLVRLAAEAAVPLVGWAAAVVEGAVLVYEVLNDLKLAYTLVNLLYDAISGVVQAKAKVVEVGFVITDLVEGLGRGVAVRAS